MTRKDTHETLTQPLETMKDANQDLFGPKKASKITMQIGKALQEDKPDRAEAFVSKLTERTGDGVSRGDVVQDLIGLTNAHNESEIETSYERTALDWLAARSW